MQHYKLYTLVDISATKQYSYSNSNEKEYSKRQNFNTVLQTLELRSNIIYYNTPSQIEIKGSLIGFNTDEIIRVWRFDFFTEHPDVFKVEDDIFYHLKKDFNFVPYINGLDELVTQNYYVFITEGSNKNIVFYN